MTKGNKSFQYCGGMDSVQIQLPNCGIITCDNGTPFEVCAEDAKILADNPDFEAASASKSTKDLKEVNE
jgi:hypothetical protein